MATASSRECAARRAFSIACASWPARPCRYGMSSAAKRAGLLALDVEHADGASPQFQGHVQLGAGSFTPRPGDVARVARHVVDQPWPSVFGHPPRQAAAEGHAKRARQPALDRVRGGLKQAIGVQRIDQVDAHQVVVERLGDESARLRQQRLGVEYGGDALPKLQHQPQALGVLRDHAGSVSAPGTPNGVGAVRVLSDELPRGWGRCSRHYELPVSVLRDVRPTTHWPRLSDVRCATTCCGAPSRARSTTCTTCSRWSARRRPSSAYRWLPS